VLGGDAESSDLILLDLQMSDMNGVEFIRHVQRRPLFKMLIIVTTAEPKASALLQQGGQADTENDRVFLVLTPDGPRRYTSPSGVPTAHTPHYHSDI
jgi:CheY-like chemotaxis protein